MSAIRFYLLATLSVIAWFSVPQARAATGGETHGWYAFIQEDIGATYTRTNLRIIVSGDPRICEYLPASRNLHNTSYLSLALLPRGEPAGNGSRTRSIPPRPGNYPVHAADDDNSIAGVTRGHVVQGDGSATFQYLPVIDGQVTMTDIAPDPDPSQTRMLGVYDLVVRAPDGSQLTMSGQLVLRFCAKVQTPQP